MPTNSEIIAELTRAKCAFQLRTIATVMDLPDQGGSDPDQHHARKARIFGCCLIAAGAVVFAAWVVL